MLNINKMNNKISMHSLTMFKNMLLTMQTIYTNLNIVNKSSHNLKKKELQP